MGWDRDFNFDNLVDVLVEQRAYTKSLEQRVKELESERDGWREMAQPGWKQREMEAALDGEIRLLREQG